MKWNITANKIRFDTEKFVKKGKKTLQKQEQHTTTLSFVFLFDLRINRNCGVEVRLL